MVKANKLTQLQATKLKEPGLHGDGAGLWLKVTEGGSMSWILRYAFNGRERWTGLGPYPDVSLAEARDKAATWRREVRQGIDPMQVKQQAAAVVRAEQAKTVTFDTCAERYIESHRSGWKSAKHAEQWTSTLQAYASPVLGKMDVALIETAHIMRVLDPVWHTKAETASRLRGRVEAILDWATVHRYRTGDNPARWKGHLDVPGERMKAGREHRVPLSNAAVELLEQLKAVKLADTETVFPSVRDHKPLSDMTLTAVLRRMQRSDITVHGFRSSFRDWAAEATDYPQEMAEMALAHIVGNKVEAAYRRGDMLEKRRAMMQAWAEHSL